MGVFIIQYNLFIAFLLIILSAILSFILVGFQIKKFREMGILARDYYKIEKKMVPTYGGISIVSSFSLIFLAIIVVSTLGIVNISISKLELVAILVIILYSVFGMIDDLYDIGRLQKVILPFFFSYPLSVLLLENKHIYLPLFGEVSFGYLVPFLIIPMYIMVVSNLINMHSGFNGLAMGLSAILIGTLFVKSIISGKNNIYLLAAMFGCLIGFLYYNFYPARVFEGNIGSLSVGSAVGIGIILNNYYIAGIIMLLPHIINFLMYVYWRIMNKMYPEDSKWRLVKFGRIRDDGSIEAPNFLTLKWLLPYYFKMTEKQVVIFMYGLTAIFCIMSLFVDY